VGLGAGRFRPDVPMILDNAALARLADALIAARRPNLKNINLMMAVPLGVCPGNEVIEYPAEWAAPSPGTRSPVFPRPLARPPWWRKAILHRTMPPIAVGIGSRALGIDHGGARSKPWPLRSILLPADRCGVGNRATMSWTSGVRRGTDFIRASRARRQRPRRRILWGLAPLARPGQPCDQSVDMAEARAALGQAWGSPFAGLGRAVAGGSAAPSSFEGCRR